MKSLGAIKESPFPLTENSVNIIFAYIVLAAATAVLVLPFLWMFSASFKYPVDILSSVSLLPRDAQTGKFYITLSNYREIFETLPFMKMIGNSFLVASVNTILNVFLNSLVAYGFARMDFPGKEKIFTVMLGTLMIPFYVIMIPLVYVVKTLGMYNTLVALILPFAMSVYNVFLTRQYLSTIPKELDEAAKIDGCGHFGIFWRVLMPLCKPILAIQCVFTFLFNWNNFAWPLIVITNSDNYTLQLGLGTLMTQAGNKIHLLMAGASLSVVPVFVLFLFMQKYIIRGITQGAVKG